MRRKIRYYTFSTRLKHKERNKLLKKCRELDLTPSEFIRTLLLNNFDDDFKIK